MPDYLRALVFVLTLAALTLAVTIYPLSVLVGRSRVVTWFGITVAIITCVFLIQDFWLILLASTIILTMATRWENDRAVLYLLAFCMTPTTVVYLTGIGGIKNLVAISFQDFLALLLFIPVLFSVSHTKGGFGKAPKQLLWAYFILVCILTFRGKTVTDSLRTSVGLTLSMIAPYLAFSTLVDTKEKMNVAIYALIFSALSLSLVGVFEFSKHWHVYEPAFRSWGNATYLLRDGQLRAFGPIFDPIAFGTIFMTGIGLCLSIPKELLSFNQRTTLFTLLILGLVSPLSRGPWLGAGINLVVFLLMGPKPVERLLKYGVLGVIGILLLLLTPVASRVISLLPYIGSEASTVTANYREKLLENSWIVIQRNPFFGSVNYFQAPEMQELIQGQGIIDVVNTYVGIALTHGLIGLALFGLFFTTVLIGLLRAFRALPESESALRLKARALFATLCGLLVTIFTVSSVGQIPYLYWMLAGLCVAQTRIINDYIAANQTQAPAVLTSKDWSPAKLHALKTPRIPVRRAPGRGRIPGG